MPRIAFFPDSFHEVNGVAHTARHFVGFAERRGIPMLCVCAAVPGKPSISSGSVEMLELPRSSLAVSMEQDLSFDPLFFRHGERIRRALARFRPEILHITGPSELGIFGAFSAWRFGLPLAASWHTNVHEYAGRRLGKALKAFGSGGQRMAVAAEDGAFAATARFYRLAKVLYAPNPQLCDLLQASTGRPCHLMQRGVDTALFSPAQRTREPQLRPLLGFVGRLSVEKNVQRLPVIDRELRSRGVAPSWLIVGQGSEEPLLRRELGAAAEFTGVLQGEALATAYANMDVLVFPSHTDTFGNVVLEALASGVPAVVTPDGGPAHIVQDGITGCIATDEGFAAAISGVLSAPERYAAMRCAARAYAMDCSWDAVFERVLAAYPVPARA